MQGNLNIETIGASDNALIGLKRNGGTDRAKTSGWSYQGIIDVTSSVKWRGAFGLSGSYFSMALLNFPNILFISDIFRVAH
jgi:hypothetical protein